MTQVTKCAFPGCDGTASIYDDGMGLFVMRCSVCCAEGPARGYIAEAIAAWNKAVAAREMYESAPIEASKIQAPVGAATDIETGE